MTRKRRRAGPIANPLDRLMPAGKAEVDELVAGFHAAIEHIARCSHPGAEEWRQLADAINTVEALTLDMGLLDIDATMPEVRSAVQAMVDAAHRWRATGQMRMDGPGLHAVREVVATYEAAARGFTRHAMTRAADIVRRRVAEAQRGAADESRVIAI